MSETSGKDDGSDPSEIEWHEGDMPYSPAFGDHFYSRADGRAECGHVFVNGNGLIERFARSDDFVIGETGFGTGLNFCETWRVWKHIAPDGATLTFTSFEKYPMRREEIMRALSRWPEIAAEGAALANAWPEDCSTSFALDFCAVRLEVKIGEALDTIRQWDQKADAWYLDGFAPSRNPDMWSAELMETIAQKTAVGGTFATYTAAGWVRRNLQAAGFIVEKRPGHAGKRDMSAGYLPSPMI